MAEKEILGYTDCPFCSSEVEIKNSKKDKPYYTCSECGHQTFFRKEKSVELLRAKARPDKKTTEVKRDGDGMVSQAVNDSGEKQPGRAGWWKW